jgi:hypothetical protein
MKFLAVLGAYAQNVYEWAPKMYEFSKNPGFFVTDIYRRFPGSWCCTVLNPADWALPEASISWGQTGKVGRAWCDGFSKKKKSKLDPSQPQAFWDMLYLKYIWNKQVQL